MPGLLTSGELRGWIDGGEESVRELGRIHHVDYVDLPGGHWPQLTQPDRLDGVLPDAANSTSSAATS